MRTFGAFIDWCLRNLLRFIIIGAIIFVVFGFVLQTCQQGPDKPPAKVEDMAYQVVTYSRIYYTDSCEWEGSDLILKNFWVKEGDKWVFYEKELRLNEAWGKREVVER